jgi:ribosomal protein S18 acetylase RimI-like enzyme
MPALDLPPLKIPNLAAEALAAQQFEHKRDPSPTLSAAVEQFIYSELETDIDADKITIIYVHAFDASFPAGGAVATATLDVREGAGWVNALFVKPEHRGKGVGEELLKRCFNISARLGKKSVGLCVHNNNARARALYERLGFFQYLDGHGDTTQLVKKL